MKKSNFILTVFAILFSGISFANNLKITNISRPANDEIKFDVAWDNSWYLNSAPNNWDAVWLFVKAQDCNTSVKAWEHVDVSVTLSDHSVSSPLQLNVVTDGKGVFVRRQSVGSGNISATSVTLKLQSALAASNVNIEVFGIEMVAVLEGAFETGLTTSYTANKTEQYYFYSFDKTTIGSEAAISAGTLKTPSTPTPTTSSIGYHPDIPAAFPKGYNKFYIMKYEISQEQYVRFLNLLNYLQQIERTAYMPNSLANTNALSNAPTGVRYRNGIKIKTPGSIGVPAIYSCDLNDNNAYSEAADGQNVSCNFLSWKDLLSYLDWSGLRPMTELEYEKACRGFAPAVENEYAWGNGLVTNAVSNALMYTGGRNEVSTSVLAAGSGIAAIGGSNSPLYGPLRVGFAATASTPTRVQSGASYWGILDLTGNVWEQTVSVGYQNSNISAFTGVLGDGELSASGEADETGWDLDPTYSVVRGGSWLTTVAVSNNYGKVGSRYFVNSTLYNLNRYFETGGRGVRQF